MMGVEMARTLENVSFLVGDEKMIDRMPELPALEPFAADMIDMLNEVSHILMADHEAKQYPDVITYAFWIRKSSSIKLKERFYKKDESIHLGRGVAFHIAPSNVPVNYAYSLAVGLLTGNANVVRVPSRDFRQVEIINRAFQAALIQEKYGKLAPYVCLVRYERKKEVNDLFSSIADTRIIWGGDDTIAEIRKSSLPPRASEVTFADRFSLAVIDGQSYLGMDDKDKAQIAEGFYNDTYLTDQNACTSPRLVVWLGNSAGGLNEAKKEFWERLHKIVEKKYQFQPIQGINKLTSACLAAVAYAAYPMDSCEMSLKPDLLVSSMSENQKGSGVKVEPHADNVLVRVKIPQIIDGLMDLKNNSGYFFEYDCRDIMELKRLCDDKHCQTIAYIGNKEMLKPLLIAGIHGIDRIVPIGATMDFDLIWDGYNLYESLTRKIIYKL